MGKSTDSKVPKVMDLYFYTKKLIFIPLKKDSISKLSEGWKAQFKLLELSVKMKINEIEKVSLWHGGEFDFPAVECLCPNLWCHQLKQHPIITFSDKKVAKNA
jgi:hypothetical protein